MASFGSVDLVGSMRWLLIQQRISRHRALDTGRPLGDSGHTFLTADIQMITGQTRRGFMTRTAAGLGGLGIACMRAAIVQTDFSKLPPYGNGTIPGSIRSRQI